MWILFRVIIFGIPILTLVWWLWANRRLKALNVSQRWRRIFGLTVLGLLAGFCWILLTRTTSITVPISPELYAVILLWGFIFLPLMALPMMTGWALWSIGSNLRKLMEKKPSISSPVEEVAPPAKMTRRQLLGSAAVAFPVLATFGATAISLPQTRRFRVTDMTVFLKDLPEVLDGMRIAHVTDTHVGKFTRGKMLADITDATNRLQADLVLITGDLIDNSLDDLPAALEMIRRMDPRSGLFMIEGNHDLFDDPAKFVRDVKGAGIPLLRNEASVAMVRGHPVQMMGIVWNHDEMQMARDVETVAKLRDPDAFPILLAHHPHAFDPAVNHGLPLTLSGHTHGGQLMVTPGLGVGPMMFRYWSGLYQNGSNSLVVSNGVGNWFPLRTRAPAEIIHLTLRRA